MSIRKQTGTSLIEILVAVFVVSVGLLGVARMELLSKQSGYEAIQRTTASMLAHDMMEKIRANPSSLVNYSSIVVGDGGVATPGTNCAAANCPTAAEIATYDIWQWEQMLMGATETSGGNNTGGLVEPRGCVSGPAGGAGAYTIAIAWRGNTPMSNPTSSDCGEGLDLYGDNEEYRRILKITFYVSDDELT